MANETSGRMLAEFSSAAGVASAARALRRRGFSRLEAYMPYWSDEIDEALPDRRRSRLPIGVLFVGILAAGGAYFLQWYLDAYLYPLDVGGRPPHFPLPFVLITFEMGILFAALAAFFGVLLLGRLVRLTDAVQGTEGFESASSDRFWLEVSMDDPEFDPEGTPEELDELGATRVEPSRRGP